MTLTSVAFASRIEVGASHTEPFKGSDRYGRASFQFSACGLAFETAVIALERGEHGADPEGAALTRARATFERLGAAPWLTRALQAGAGSAPAG
jgi:hypothetical protein